MHTLVRIKDIRQNVIQASMDPIVEDFVAHIVLEERIVIGQAEHVLQAVSQGT